MPIDTTLQPPVLPPNGGQTGAPPAPPADPGSTSPGSAGDTGSVSSELAQLLQDLGLSGTGGGANGTGDGASPPGAPTLQAPTQEMSPAQMAAAVQVLMSKLSDAQTKAAKNSLSDYSHQQEANHQKAIQAADKAAKAAAKAKKKNKILKALGIVGKIVGLIATVAMTALTGGAMAPLAAVVIGYTATDTLLTAADAISQAKGGPSLTLDTVLKDTYTGVAESFGIPADKAKGLANWMTTATQIGMSVAMIGISLGNAFSDADKLVTLGAKGTMVAKVLQAQSQTVNGGVTATTGGVTIVAAQENTVATEAQADAQRVNASMVQCKAMIDAVSGFIGDTLQQTSTQTSLVGTIAKSAHQTGVAVINPPTA
jgi:hypothetical protein